MLDVCCARSASTCFRESGGGVLLNCVAGPVFHSGSLGSLTTSKAKFLRTTAGVKPETVSPG